MVRVDGTPVPTTVTSATTAAFTVPLTASGVNLRVDLALPPYAEDEGYLEFKLR
jgi:hypothetical protein